MKKLLLAGIAVILAGGGLVWHQWWAPVPVQWSSTQQALIRSLSLSALPELPPDPSNAVADSDAAAELGHALFFDTRLSSNNAVACSTCHQPEKYFTDNLPLAVGESIGPRHTPGLVGLSHSPWYYWDGRKDSQWAQALAPLEAAHEHNFDRTRLAKLISNDPLLAELYLNVFANIPEIPDLSASPNGDADSVRAWQSLDASEQDSINEVFTNAGKALAAYQRKLQPGRTRFDDYADALDSGIATGTERLSRAEKGGLALFIGKAQCVDCHNGPLLTNHEFHNTGILSISGQLPSMGRFDGIREARQDPFNCLGEFSDAEPAECTELRFARDGNELVGAHKTPTLRNVDATAPYMHGGQIQTLREVLEHYNNAPVSMLSHNEAKPLGLRPAELRQLEAFLHTLTAPLATDPFWLQPPAAISGAN